MLEMFFHKIWTIWTAGGWVMIPLFGLSLLMYGSAVSLLRFLGRREFHRLDESTWRKWITNPSEGSGEVGDIIRFTQSRVRSLNDVHCRFREVMADKLPTIDRRLQYLNTLVAAAPLLGLLGTVLGMLVTFQVLSVGGGGQVTDRMAAGISQALFPPEVGLCIALPGLMFVHFIRRKRQEYEAFLARLESFTVQHLKRKMERRLHKHSPDPERALANA